MALMMNVSIDISKIPTNKLIEGKNGAKYYNFTVAANDETNEKTNQNVSAWVSQSKEEREAKKKKEYLGGGRVFWTKGETPIAAPINKDGGGSSYSSNQSSSSSDNDLPF